MKINLDLIGKDLEPYTWSYDQDTVILYALGVGAGTHEPDLVYEKDLKVLPTFVTVPFVPVLLNVLLPAAGMKLEYAVHGEHELVLHRPIPTSGELVSTIACDAIYDKGDSGAVIHISIEIHDGNGELVSTNRAVIVDRFSGNFGGNRGPKAPKILPPEGVAPDFSATETVPVNQAALYRLCGDKNPLHIDPEFAGIAGFERPILHGLCTLGYAGRAIVRHACGGEPERLRAMSIRFANVVFPGDTLTTEGWQEETGRIIFRTINQDGTLILGNAVATVV